MRSLVDQSYNSRVQPKTDRKKSNDNLQPSITNGRVKIPCRNRGGSTLRRRRHNLPDEQLRAMQQTRTKVYSLSHGSITLTATTNISSQCLEACGNLTNRFA